MMCRPGEIQFTKASGEQAMRLHWASDVLVAVLVVAMAVGYAA